MTDIAKTPTQGKRYKVKKGDTLWRMAAIAYGNGREYPRIASANKLRSGDPDLIFPGEIFLIPGDPVLEKIQKEKKSQINPEDIPGIRQNFELIVEGIRVPVVSARLLRTMDTAADGWSAVVKWDPENSEQNQLFRPYGYQESQVYLDGELMIDGIVYIIENSNTTSGIQKTLEGFSPTADIIDSSMNGPFVRKNISLKDRAIQLCEPHGIDVVFDFDESDIDPFKKVEAEAEDKKFDHLSSLAEQRGVLISSTPGGSLLFLKPNTDSEPVDTITDSRAPNMEIKARFDGRQRFSVYNALSDTDESKPTSGSVRDPEISRSRFLTFKADDTDAANVEEAADWKRRKKIADALTIPFPVSGWRDRHGNLWRENTLVTVIAPSIHVPDGFTFLIKSVEFSLSTTGRTAVLNIIPPQVYDKTKDLEGIFTVA